MTNSKTTAAPAVEQPAAPNPAAALIDLVRALTAAVKFPNSPIPPAVTGRIDEALQRFEAAAGSFGPGGAAEVDGSAELASRIAELEQFAEKVNADLPARLAKLEEGAAGVDDLSKRLNKVEEGAADVDDLGKRVAALEKAKAAQPDLLAEKK